MAPSSTHWEYAVVRSSSQLQRLARALRSIYLAQPGLMTKILAIVAFLSIGLV